MSYVIGLSDTAKDDLSDLDNVLRGRVIRKLKAIKDDPFGYVKRLTGVELYSLRVGNFRAIMSIEERRNIILVVRIGPRKNVYDVLYIFCG